jgi:hypothetical protein
LLGGLKAAEEEAEAAWAAADEDQRVEGTQLEEARALGRQEVVDKLKQVEAALASAREEIERLRRGEQVAGRPEIQPQVAVEAARIPAPPQDAAEEVMRRVAAFF